MDTNKRRFLVVEKVSYGDSSQEIWMMIPTDSIEVISGLKDGTTVIFYRFDGQLHHVDGKQRFSDISNGKWTVEL